MNLPVICYAGMTHLGLVSAVASAEKGFSVTCFDIDPERIEKLSKGVLPVVEPDLDTLFTKNSARLSFTSEVRDLAGCDVIYIAQDVPTDDTGASDLQPIADLIGVVGSHMRPGSTLVILCQVPPGFTRGLPAVNGHMYYLVETLIFGRAVERALYPERFIVGCADPKVALPEPLSRYLGAFGCPILPMRFESAELAKISINCFLVSSVSTSNTLAELCERIGADWSEIVPALRLDKRIGAQAYLSPGLGIAGGNLERDLATVCRLGDAEGTDVRVVRSWMLNNAHRRHWALRTLHEHVLHAGPEPTLAILGLAYKKDTNSIKNSPSLGLIEHLAPYPIRFHDPVVPSDAVAHPKSSPCASAIEACKDVQAAVIMTPWDEYARLDPTKIAEALAGDIVIDPYGVLSTAKTSAAGLRHFVLGSQTSRG
jgi:UDPglucose 6-dehydrogenase